MLSELHEVELNLFPVVASMTGPAESEADGLVPESVNGTFKSIILIKEPVPLREVLVAGQDDASRLFETDAVYQLEEEKSLLPVELAVADLIDDEAGILGKSVQKSSCAFPDESIMELLLQLIHLDEVGLHLVRAAFVADGHRKMCLSRTRRTYHDDVPLGADEGKVLQRMYLSPGLVVQKVHVEVLEGEGCLLWYP